MALAATSPSAILAEHRRRETRVSFLLWNLDDPYSSRVHVLPPEENILIQINQFNNLTRQKRWRGCPFESLHVEADKRRSALCSGSDELAQVNS